ncbi:hypothetical protein ACFO3O_16590 [Dokdonia ponticola]|uniref:Uncharacterized protein n=1 Tax=Dokdonia ponticola TaxID=2041041 RepID=A0ABV9I1D7_9FLAO
MIHRKLLLLAFILTMTSCLEKSEFFSDCACKKNGLSKGIEVTDNLDRFTVILPNENWKAYLHTDELGNGFVGAVLDKNSFKTFGVTELTKAEDWMNKEQQRVEI